MKYRALWSQRPLSAIEEEESEGEGDPSGGEGTVSPEGGRCRSLTPYDRKMRPPALLTTRGYAASPEGSSSLSDTLKKIIDTATINVVGFEESFAAHLNADACSLMWNLCQVYGKTRMAIDLVERELIATKQELELANQLFEDLCASEEALCDGIEQTRYYKGIADLGIAKWRREYRRALDENAIMRLKTNRYQLHLDRMESACSEISHQNYSIKSFLVICKEKDKKQTRKTVKISRYSVRNVTGDSLVNGRHCNTPRRHCPKVTLSLPKPGQAESEVYSRRFPPGYRRRIAYCDRSFLQRITTAFPWAAYQEPCTRNEEVIQSDSLSSLEDNHAHLPHFTGSVAVTPDIPSHVQKVVELELGGVNEHCSVSVCGQDDLNNADGVGYVVIPEFETEEDKEETTVQHGEKDQTVNPESYVHGVARGSSDATESINHSESDSSEQNAESSPPEPRDHVQIPNDKYTDNDTSVTEATSQQVVPSVEKIITGSGSSDDLSTAVRETVSSYLSGSEVKDTESIAKRNQNQNQTHSQNSLPKRPVTAARFPQHGRPPLHEVPFIMARGIALQRVVSEQNTGLSSRCTCPLTVYRSHMVHKNTNPELQRPATCSAAYHESSDTRRLFRPGRYSKDRAVPVMNDTQFFLPPLTSPRHSQKHADCAQKPREVQPLAVKDKQPGSSLPTLPKSDKYVSRFAKAKAFGPKQKSENLRAQLRSFTRQLLPALPSSEISNTKFHQVLLIRSCSSERMERPALSLAH